MTLVSVCVMLSSVFVTCQHGQCCGLPGTVVSKQDSDLPLEHVHGEIMHSEPCLVAHFKFLTKKPQ